MCGKLFNILFHNSFDISSLDNEPYCWSFDAETGLFEGVLLCKVSESGSPTDSSGATIPVALALSPLLSITVTFGIAVEEDGKV